MSIQIGDLNIANEIIELHFQVIRTQIILDKLLIKNPKLDLLNGVDMINIEKDRFYRLCMFLIINEIVQLKEILEKEEQNKENVKEIFSQVKSFKNYYNFDFSSKEKVKEIKISEDNFILMKRIDNFLLSFQQP